MECGPAAATTELCLLGGFELRVGGQAVALPTQAQRVLGCLAVVAPSQRRESLAGRLWAESSQERAQANLRNAVWRVRQLSDRVLAGGRDVIALDGGAGWPSTCATPSAGPTPCCATTTDGAADVAGIDLLDDDLLPAWDEPWALNRARAGQRQLRMHALERLSASLLRGQERYPQAITVCAGGRAGRAAARVVAGGR